MISVNFTADAEAGAAEMRRVARRAVTSCVWDYAGQMTILRAFRDAALKLDPGAPDEGRTMRYRTLEEPAALWRKGGLRAVETRPLEVEAAYGDFDDYWSPFPAGIAPSGRIVSRSTRTDAPRCVLPPARRSRSARAPGSSRYGLNECRRAYRSRSTHLLAYRDLLRSPPAASVPRAMVVRGYCSWTENCRSVQVGLQASTKWIGGSTRPGISGP